MDIVRRLSVWWVALTVVWAVVGGSPGVSQARGQGSSIGSSVNPNISKLEPLSLTSNLSPQCRAALSPQDSRGAGKLLTIAEVEEDEFGLIKAVYSFTTIGSAFPDYRLEGARRPPLKLDDDVRVIQARQESIEIVRRAQGSLQSISTSTHSQYLISVRVLEQHIAAILGLASEKTVARDPKTRRRLMIGVNYYRDWERQVGKYALEVCGTLSFVGLNREDTPHGLSLVTAGPNAGLLQAPDGRLFIPGLAFFR